ncbi:MAG TPA: ABC transporter permease [Candidatus Dojkabacteria bacterium]|nr:ABC transporter permease [Candidatus Dojkabacteria bacterium]
MKFFRILKQSFKAIMANKVRSFLTVLGIIIGIGSVIGLMSLGTGVKESINGQINSLGSTNLTIMTGFNMSSRDSYTTNPQEAPKANGAMFGSSQSLTQEDFLALEKISSDLVSNIAAYASSQVILKTNGKEQRGTIIGVSSDYFTFYDLNLSSGEYPKGKEVVLGDQLAKDLFGDTNPIGQDIPIMDIKFKVSGILEIQDETNFSNPNLQAYITDQEAFKLFGTDNYNSIIAKATSEDTVDDAKTEIESVLLTTHKIDDKNLADFFITSPNDLLSTVDTVMTMLTSFLAGIAAISLLVGGIGIMNIMLVSVTERTREIGLRKALGAQTSNILIQFMTEAVVLTVIGGIFGILTGYVISLIASKFLGFDAIITFDSILLAVSISSFIGIIFGIYPAARAARLNPIDALRYE